MRRNGIRIATATLLAGPALLAGCGRGGGASTSASMDSPLTAGGATSASAPPAAVTTPAPTAPVAAPTPTAAGEPLPLRRAGLWRLETTNPFSHQPTSGEACLNEQEAATWSLTPQQARQCPDYRATAAGGRVLGSATCQSPGGFSYQIQVTYQPAPDGESFTGSMTLNGQDNGQPVTGTGAISGRRLGDCDPNSGQGRGEVPEPPDQPQNQGGTQP